MKIFLLAIGILILFVAVILFAAFAFAVHTASVIYKDFFD